MGEMEEFEKSVLGDAPISRTVAPVEEVEEKETWETMSLKELRKYYKTQLVERRAREDRYLGQRNKCKILRARMAELMQ